MIAKINQAGNMCMVVYPIDKASRFCEVKSVTITARPMPFFTKN